jgi:hypothetical protein
MAVDHHDPANVVELTVSAAAAAAAAAADDVEDAV